MNTNHIGADYAKGISGMEDFNFERVEFYPSSDMAYAYYKDRIVEIVSGQQEYTIDTINDCIEIQQCSLTIDEHSCLFSKNEYEKLKDNARKMFGEACEVASTLLSERGLSAVYEAVEGQYSTRFWHFLTNSGLYKLLSGVDLQSLLLANPHTLFDVTECKPLVKMYDEEIAVALKESPIYAAQLIIRFFGVKNNSSTKCNLPVSLTFADIDEIMMKFMAEDDPGLNYVRILATWPPSAKSVYRPSPKVLVTAKKRAEELNSAFFQDGRTITFKHGINVSFSPKQKACKAYTYEDNILEYSYSTQWLMKYTDPGTILNNFIYVFDAVENTGLLTVPACKHERTALMEALGLHPLDEYPGTMQFDMRNTHMMAVVFVYRRLLLEADMRLEAALEWFFNNYIAEEFEIAGFRISLPTESTSWLDKCKSIGPEIERVLKAFQVYVHDGVIEPEYFPHISIKLFSEIPSLITEKYLVESDRFSRDAYTLFSDQSRIAYSGNHHNYRSFFSMINAEHVIFEDFPEMYRPLLEGLESDGFIYRDEDSYIMPSKEAWFLFRVWEQGAVAIFHFTEKDKVIADRLVQDGYLKYCEALFTPDESDYLNYMFNNAKFSNPVALRNRYDHASGAPLDPHSRDLEEDYCRFLVLLIFIILKINEELIATTCKGGVKNFIDWPLIDKYQG